jgi:hypothetical protein
MGGVQAEAADARAVHEGMPYSFPTNTSKGKELRGVIDEYDMR